MKRADNLKKFEAARPKGAAFTPAEKRNVAALGLDAPLSARGSMEKADRGKELMDKLRMDKLGLDKPPTLEERRALAKAAVLDSPKQHPKRAKEIEALQKSLPKLSTASKGKSVTAPAKAHTMG